MWIEIIVCIYILQNAQEINFLYDLIVDSRPTTV